jgi:hypothetical protein
MRLLRAAKLHKTLRLASLVDTQAGMHDATDWCKQIQQLNTCNVRRQV